MELFNLYSFHHQLSFFLLFKKEQGKEVDVFLKEVHEIDI